MLVISVPLAYLAGSWLGTWAFFASISPGYVLTGLAAQWTNQRALVRTEGLSLSATDNITEEYS